MASLDFLAQIPDHPQAQPKRMSNLQAHLDYNGPHIAAGQLVMSGPTLAAHPAENEAPNMTGSVLLYRASSANEVWDILRANPYAVEGVWDMDRAVVTPFKCAVRKPL